MGMRFYKPTSAGRRGGMVSDFSEITDRKKKPEKSLIEPFKKKGGRNFQGKITSRHRGGGHKRMYRLIDFRREKDGVSAVVTHIEYDPNRTSRIALLQYADGEKRYIIAPEGLVAGMTITNGLESEPKVGNSLPLSKIPTGTVIHNIELQPGKGAQLCRSAGTSAVMNATESGWAQVTLPSGEVRRVPRQLPGHNRSRRLFRAFEPCVGEGGSSSLDGGSPLCSRIGNESGGSSDGWWRRSSIGWSTSGQPHGKIGQRGRTRNPRKPTRNAIVRRRKSVRYGQLKL